MKTEVHFDPAEALGQECWWRGANEACLRSAELTSYGVCHGGVFCFNDHNGYACQELLSVLASGRKEIDLGLILEI